MFRKYNNKYAIYRTALLSNKIGKLHQKRAFREHPSSAVILNTFCYRIMISVYTVYSSLYQYNYILKYKQNVIVVVQNLI